MGRHPRVLADRMLYHVYSRVSRRQGIFVQGGEPEAFVELLREIKKRDGLQVLAWCVMTNHLHLLVRTGTVPLSRSMRSLQGRFAAGYNRRHGLIGPLWQSRYRAKPVLDDSYFLRLVAYIHLNPVAAGLVDRPGAYRWSGHAELTGRRHAELVDVERTLEMFDEDQDEARRAYLRLVRALRRDRKSRKPGAEWDEESRRGAPEPHVGGRRDGATVQRRTRPADPAPLEIVTYVGRVSEVFSVPVSVLAGRQQGRSTGEAREALILVGTERLRFKLSALAAQLGKSPETASRWVSRGAQRRLTDPAFAEKVGALERAVDLQDARRSWPGLSGADEATVPVPAGEGGGFVELAVHVDT